ncbi:MAG TPA: 3-deoxy-manno-octulosonate cytidylyltransferase [Thermoanaerobaculia bacterium]|nr:3-deoxy-manno-octulosonate cytidylyltransferase [Thermoanaerobaculia bacterium]
MSEAIIMIPARYGSTRFPGKPLAMIAGTSLIQRVYQRARLSALASAVYVATDDRRIAAHVEEFGGRAVMTGTEYRSGSDRIAAAVRQMGADVAQVIDLQGDEPLVDIDAVDRMIETLRGGEADAATLCCSIGSQQEFLDRNVVKVVSDLSGRALYFSRAPIPFGDPAAARRHVGVYGYQTATLLAFSTLQPSPLELSENLEQLRLLQNGFTIRVLETSEPQIGVDTPEDVARVEDALRQRSS